MIRHPPANTGDMDSIHGKISGKSGKISQTVGQLSLCITTTEPMHLELKLCNKRNCHDEKPMSCDWRVALAHHNQRKHVHSNEDPVQPNINKY